ncbi:MAG: hypothetical protein LUC33_02465, partial [Prevotellaceae bacterium]|nr:hypothetical protein [Prevotellaceae bacterium]
MKSTFFGNDGFKHAYILSAKTLGLKFSSGRLNGLEFDVMFLGASGDTDTEYTSPDGAQWFELVANESYGSLLPSEALRPEEGDGFVLYNWQAVDTSTGEITDATKKMIAEAERELLGYAVEYLRDMMVDDGVYECDMHPGYIYAGGVESLRIARAFAPGQRILLVNDALFDVPRESRVVGFTVNLDIPYDHPVYKVGESVKYSRIGDVEDKVSELVYNGNSYTTSGSGSSGVYLIKTNDSAAATNFNAYSALRALNTFLRKDKDDSTDHGVTTKKGFYIGDFVSGSSGASVFQDSETGETTAEVDRLYVRLKAYFEQLETVNVDSVGGKQVITPGGSVKVSSVEETDDAYRCHFLAEQEGEKVENRFAVGDQAYSQIFNAREGVDNLIANHYYWRLVTAVGEDYIDLSKTDCDTDSDIPVAGDTICQLGSRANSDRRNALIFSSVDSFSPSITLYEGIDSYSFSGKDVVSFGVDKTTGKAFFNVYGDMYIGDRDGNAYVKYVQEKDQDTGEVTSSEVEIKGKLGVGTTLSDGSVLEETFPKIFTKQPADGQSYSVGDMWLNATYGDKYSNDILYAVEDKAAGEPFSIDHWALSSDYNNWKQYAYLKKALREYTSIEGGLIQSSVLALGYTEEKSGEYKVMSGTSGIYDADALGGGIASWWGGAMKDKDTYDSDSMPDDVAKALIRMDGTGYLAGGALWWESDGKIHADPNSFIIRENQLGDYLLLFQIVYKKGSDEDIDYVIPQYSFQKLDIGSTGLNEISEGVLYINGDLVVKGGITMYAESGEYKASTWLDLLPIDTSTLSKDGGVLSVIGGTGSGLEGIVVNNATYEPVEGYITLPDYSSSWNELTDKPSWLSSTVGG